MVSHHGANFGDQGYFGSEDVIFLICYVISQDHVHQELLGFIDRSPARQATIKFGVNRHFAGGVVCHVILESYVIKGSCVIMFGSPS